MNDARIIVGDADYCKKGISAGKSPFTEEEISRRRAKALKVRQPNSKLRAQERNATLLQMGLPDTWSKDWVEKLVKEHDLWERQLAEGGRDFFSLLQEDDGSGPDGREPGAEEKWMHRCIYCGSFMGYTGRVGDTVRCPNGWALAENGGNRWVKLPRKRGDILVEHRVGNGQCREMIYNRDVMHWRERKFKKGIYVRAYADVISIELLWKEPGVTRNWVGIDELPAWLLKRYRRRGRAAVKWFTDCESGEHQWFEGDWDPDGWIRTTLTGLPSAEVRRVWNPKEANVLLASRYRKDERGDADFTPYLDPEAAKGSVVTATVLLDWEDAGDWSSGQFVDEYW